MFLLLLLQTAAFAQSKHFCLAVKLGIPTGSWSGSSPYVAGNPSDYYGGDFQFGQRLGAGWGYTAGIGSMGVRRGKVNMDAIHQDESELRPYEAASLTFSHLILGVWRASAGNGFDVYVNCRYGQYRILRNRVEDEIDASGASHPVFYSTESRKQSGATVLEVGVRKRIRWGFWGNASYNYGPLDKDKTKADSMQWATIGLGYVWGRQ